ncbi:MAG TPA: transcription factor S [Candidatus Thermoplasmatota archaeon]|nr:transcription factor S [Candidatus Thermoplasmatota archaeon]
MFCPNDKALMRPVNGVLTCPKCGATPTAKSTAPVLRSEAKVDIKKGLVVDVEKDKLSLLPTADYNCEKCGNTKAYYYMRQTRSADEATTRFLECTKCGYKWREYR